MIRRLLLFFSAFLLSLLLWHNFAQAAGNIKYDFFFKRWGQFYFPYEDWKWWKSQGIVESSLNPYAVSGEGAIGIMQLLPSTAKDIGCSYLFEAEININCGIKYDRWIQSYLTEECVCIKCHKPTIDLIFYSYNGGVGRVIKNIGQIDKLPAESLNYVRKIRRAYKRGY